MQNIIISAVDMWAYFKDNEKELKTTEHLIAENDEYGVEIYLTEQQDKPCFTVTADGYEYEEESAVSEADCRKTIEALYDKYLTEKFLEVEPVESLLDQEDMIAEREMELDDAIMLMLDTIVEEDAAILLSCNTNNLDEICDDIKDHMLEYIARKHGIEIRRPMILEDDETGEDFFTEYPYECMVYDDEDNPIYK